MNAQVATPTLAAKPNSYRLRLACPACRQSLPRPFAPDSFETFSFTCGLCKHEVHKINGIWRALSPERSTYFHEFMEDYQRIRFAERRGSATAEFYLNLPYRDTTGSHVDQWAIRASSFRCFEHEILPTFEAGRESLDVLDLGAGNGWLSYRVALRGHRPVAVDLMTDSRDGLSAAQHFRSNLGVLFPCVQAELDNLPFAGDQFDLAVFNASFHYSEDYQRTLAEALRCLKPGGAVVIADTAWYSSEVSGVAMVAERHASFSKHFGTASDAIRSLEFLTDERLISLERHFGFRWRVYTPFYGLRWAMRPLMARLRGRREPSTFRIYVAEVKK